MPVAIRHLQQWLEPGFLHSQRECLCRWTRAQSALPRRAKRAGPSGRGQTRSTPACCIDHPACLFKIFPRCRDLPRSVDQSSRKCRSQPPSLRSAPVPPPAQFHEPRHSPQQPCHPVCSPSHKVSYHLCSIVENQLELTRQSSKFRNKTTMAKRIATSYAVPMTPPIASSFANLFIAFLLMADGGNV